MAIIERMKTNAKEMGSTNWELMGEFQGATKKQTIIALAYLKDVKAIEEMPLYGEKAINDPRRLGFKRKAHASFVRIIQSCFVFFWVNQILWLFCML